MPCLVNCTVVSRALRTYSASNVRSARAGSSDDCTVWTCQLLANCAIGYHHLACWLWGEQSLLAQNCVDCPVYECMNVSCQIQICERPNLSFACKPHPCGSTCDALQWRRWWSFIKGANVITRWKFTKIRIIRKQVWLIDELIFQ